MCACGLIGSGAAKQHSGREIPFLSRFSQGADRHADSFDQRAHQARRGFVEAHEVLAAQNLAQNCVSYLRLFVQRLSS